MVQETSARREQPDPLHSSNSFQRLSDSVMHASFGGGHNNNSRNHPHTSSQPFLPKPHSKSLDLYSTPNAYSPRNPVLPGMLKRKYRDASQPQLGKTPSESRIVLAANSAAAGPYPGDHRAPRASLGSQSSYAPHNSRVPVVSDTARVSDAYHSQSNKTTTSSDVAGSFASQFPRTAAVGIGAHMSTANVTNVNNRHNSTFDGDGRPNSNENHGNENEDDKEDDHLEKDDDTDASIESDDPLDDDYRNFWPGANNGNSHGTSGAGASAGNGTKLPASAQPNARFGHLGRGRKGRKRDPAKPPGTDNPKVPKKRVTQDQIDIIIQWILDHPFDEFPSQKFYWEDFATKVSMKWHCRFLDGRCLCHVHHSTSDNNGLFLHSSAPSVLNVLLRAGVIFISAISSRITQLQL